MHKYVNKFKYLLNIYSNYRNWLYIIVCRILKKNINKVVLRSGITIEGGVKSLVVDIVDEIFIREVYCPPFLKLNPNDIVVDIGANIGVFSLYSKLHGASRIVSVEPLDTNVKLIKNNFQINKLSLPDIANIALFKKESALKLYLYGHDSHSMLFKPEIESSNAIYKRVRGMRLSTLLKTYGLDKIDFMKIDCEGAEGYIIENSNKDNWKNIKKIAIEYHNNVSILDNISIVKKLVSYGYKTKTFSSDEVYGYIYAWR